LRALVVAALCALGLATAGPTSVVSDTGIAGVRFGLPRAAAVSALTRLFGHPSRTMINSGCGPRFTEVAWGHLFVEFRDGRLAGFRYMQAGWLPQGRSPEPTPLRLLQPKLVTVEGVSLGSTLGRLRAAYGRLDLVGTDRWRTPDGLVFYDDATRQPSPPSSRIVEIKYGTCGDF
jgi:hypothetical protein